MNNFDDVLAVDAEGHVSEDNIDFTARLPEKQHSRSPTKTARA